MFRVLESKQNHCLEFWNRKKISSLNGAGSSELEWCICGHSFGGYAAMRLAPGLANHLGKSDTDKLKVVVWAAGARQELLTDLTQMDNMDALVLLGNLDPICHVGNDELKVLKSYLPKDTQQIKFIDRATHHNFASYAYPPSGDNGLTKMEQQNLVSLATNDFISK